MIEGRNGTAQLQRSKFRKKMTLGRSVQEKAVEILPAVVEKLSGEEEEGDIINSETLNMKET